MRKVLFNGYYGHQNTGDDAFMEVSAWGATKYWNINQLKFISRHMPDIQSKCEHTGESSFKGHEFLKSLQAILMSHVFICAGGSTFHSQLNAMNPKSIARLKKRLFPKFKLGAIGVSLGPYKSLTAEKENIELLKKFDFLGLRDKFSYQISMNYNLPYEPIEAFDLAALLPEVYADFPHPEFSPDRKIIGISICNYESYLISGNTDNEKRRNKHIESLLTRIARLNNETVFRFFVFNGNPVAGDFELTMNVADKMKSIRSLNVEVILYDPCIYNTWLKIKECKMLISTRLHASIFACFVNIPFFLVEYHRKCSDFLEDVGYEEKFRIYDADFDPQKFALKIVRLIEGEESFQNPSNISLVIRKARFNFTKIRLNE